MMPDFIPRSLWQPNSPDLNPVDYTAWDVLHASLQGEDSDCGGVVAVYITEEWARLESVSLITQRSAPVLVSLQTADILIIFCDSCTAFAVNAEFYCHINRCSALK